MAQFFNHGWTRMNTDVLRWMESQDLSVWIGVDPWFVLSLGIRVWREVASGWAEFFNHGWTWMNTDGFARDRVAGFMRVDLWFVTLLSFGKWWDIDDGLVVCCQGTSFCSCSSAFHFPACSPKPTRSSSSTVPCNCRGILSGLTSV